jgi:phosphoribosyl 1,2-cyclic phosphodiesterase
VLRFKNLGSGSAGNATVVEARCGAQVSRLLIDCGLSVKELSKRLAQADLNLDDLDAVFVTHEHADHIGHTQQLAKRTSLPVWMSRGTALASGVLEWGLPSDQLHFAKDGQPISLGALQLQPFTVPHDAREPLQLRCSDGAHSLGVLTDLGHGSDHVVQALQACHALLLECNHDSELLSQSAYPSFLKKRIAGPLGHLSNAESAQLASALRHDGLNLLVAAHLSERNNRPDMAQTVLSLALDCAPEDIPVADPLNGTPWYTVH